MNFINSRLFLWLAFVLLIAYGVIAQPRLNEESGTRVARPRDLQKAAETVVRDSFGGSVRASLQIKESVDFLIVPALLVQESISDEILITYPSE